MEKLHIGVNIDSYTNIFTALNFVIRNKCNVLQIYLGDKRLTTLSKKIKLSNKQIELFRKKLKENNIQLFVHSILTLNFCKDPHSERNKWGIENLVFDMNLAEKLGATGVVLHSNSYKTPTVNLTFDQCLHNFIESLKLALNQTNKINILIETPVNREYMMGGTIETLAQLYNKIGKSYKDRVKICIDTQHIFASGVNVSNEKIIKQYFTDIDKQIGFGNVMLIHLNDSLKEFDSGIDRHESIGKGFIFSKNEESLKYIVSTCEKKGIAMILETGFVNLKHDLDFIKKIIMKGGSKKKNIKQKVIKIFSDLLLDYEFSLMKTNESKDSEFSLMKERKTNNKSIIPYKIESYKRAINSLKKFDKPIYSSNDVKDVEYIGKSFRDKIDEIANTGKLSSYIKIKKDNKHLLIKVFENIWGVGKEKVSEIITKNIKSIKELKNAIEEKKIFLTNSQLIGLKYYKELNKLIPRNEITQFTEKINKLLIPVLPEKKWKIHNAGSYRMGKKECGDIDLVISHKNVKNIKNIFYKTLSENNIIIDTLSSGVERSIYIIQNNKHIRKMDIAFIDEKYLVWYLFYFGKGRDFSKKIRILASKKGYKLTDKRIFDRKTNIRIHFEPKTEDDILKFIIF